MKVFVLAPRENWICDRIAHEYERECSELVVKDPNEADVLWLLAGWCWNHVPVELLASKKVVVSVHHIVPEKFTTEKKQQFIVRDAYVDTYHVPNKYTAAFISNLTEKPIRVIPYWVDDRKWQDLEKKDCKARLGIDNDSIVIGSFQRDSEGETATAKLEKGPDIFCDLIEKIPKNFLKVVVLLGGWRRKYVVNRLTKANIDFILHEMVSQEELEIMYNACDCYVVSSRHEGGPQAVLEAAKMKVPIVSTPVGLAEKVLHKSCIYSIENMSKGNIMVPVKEVVEYNAKKVQDFYLSKIKSEYNRMFVEVLN